MPFRLFLFCLLFVMHPLRADITTETLKVEEFNGAGPHGILVMNFENKAEIYDADTGALHGQISLGYGANYVEIDRHNKQFHVAETYLSRHTRGERTDVVSSYSFRNLSSEQEVMIPAKHSSGSPIRSYSGISGDGRFMLVNNITPAMSVSVVDLKRAAFIGEIATAGCGLVYPVGKRDFLQLCGDGRMQLISLDKTGKEASRTHSEKFFEMEQDPVMEKAVKTDAGWIFMTFKGQLFLVSASRDAQIAIKPLFTLDAEMAGWRPGGLQPIAYHQPSHSLLVLMHEGGDDTHKDPGTEVWLFDLTSQRLLHRQKLEQIASAIEVSQDENPLIYTLFIGSETLDIYDLRKGRKIRSIEGLASAPTFVMNL